MCTTRSMSFMVNYTISCSKKEWITQDSDAAAATAAAPCAWEWGQVMLELE